MFHHVFRLARPGGGYAYYGEAQRLPALFYLQFNFLSLVLAALALAAILVVLLPALHRKLPTLLVGLTAILTGTVAGYGLIIPEWQVGFLELPSAALSYQQYRHAPLLWPQPDLPQNVTLGLRIGLTGANFTLVHSPLDNLTFYWDERIEFDSLAGMYSQFRDSLRRGLPVAVLELQEQVVGCGEDFMWPFHLRRAGYWCSWLMVAAITVWAFTCLLLVMVPTVGAASLALTGLLLLAVPTLYSSMLPYKAGPSGRLLVAGRTVPLHFGPCLWVTVLGGLWATVVGINLYIYHSRHPNIFFTDFDMDYEEHEETRRKSLALDALQQEKARTSGFQDTRL